MELLLNTPGIDVNTADRNGRTSLYLAAEVSYNHIEHLKYICIQYIYYFMLTSTYITGGTHCGCGAVAENNRDRRQCSR